MDRKSGREDAAENDNTEENTGRVPPRYQEVAVDHTAVSDMKYKQMNRAVLTEFLSYSSLKRSKGNTHLFHFLRLWAKSGNQTWIQGWHCI